MEVKVHFSRRYSSYFRVLILVVTVQSVCDAYHGNLCIGSADKHNSIGSGVEEARNRKFFDSAVTSSGTFHSKGSMTHYIIKYESTDIADTENSLFGWLSVTVDLDDQVKGVLIQPYVTDDKVVAVPGDLVVTRFKAGCKEIISDNDPFHKWYMAPCYSAKSPTFFVPHGAAVSKEFKTIRFTFRTDFPECTAMNQQNQLEFRFYGSNGIKDELWGPQQTRVGMYKDAYGSYDPEPPRGSTKVSCSTKLSSNSRPNWITAYNQTALLDKGKPLLRDYGCYAVIGQRFEGRCQNNDAGDGREYYCDRFNNERNWTVGGPAHGPYEPDVPMYPTDGRPCGGCEIAKNITRTSGVSANSQVGQMLWGLRGSHGICMTLTTMLVLPLGFLLVRYYKDSFMAYRYVNMHVWYGIHIGTSMAGFAGLLSGWVVAILGSRYFGWSTHPTSWVHRICGYLSLLLFVLGIGSGPYRKFVRGGRTMTIFFHFLFGDIARILFDICLLTSFYIPGSPSSKNDIHTAGFTMELSAFVVIGWIIVDVVVHIFLHINMSSTDKGAKMPNKRTYAVVVPIPLLRPSVEKDVPGTGLRKIVLFVHTGVGLVCTVFLTYMICFSEPFGRFYGPMSYTHKPSGKLNFLMEDMDYSPPEE